MKDDMENTHGHIFNLFEFRWMNDAKSFSIFEITGWDHGNPYSASLFGFTFTKTFAELSILFMNVGFLRE